MSEYLQVYVHADTTTHIHSYEYIYTDIHPSIYPSVILLSVGVRMHRHPRVHPAAHRYTRIFRYSLTAVMQNDVRVILRVPLDMKI